MIAPVRFRALAGVVAFSIAFPLSLEAQRGGPSIAPSGRATTTVTLNRPAPSGGGARPAPANVTIDYGQPHLRGRDVLTLIPQDQVWRLGANTSTSLKTDVDLVIGGATVPAGTYTLYVLRSPNGSKLIINKQTGQWGTEYSVGNDLARVDMRSSTLSQPLESLQIALVPAQGRLGGVLRVIWGTVALETDWSVKQ